MGRCDFKMSEEDYKSRAGAIEGARLITPPSILLTTLKETIQTQCTLRSRLAAAIVHRERILISGVNKLKTHPIQKRFATSHHKTFLHAEIACIIEYIKFQQRTQTRYSSLDFYIMRLLANDTLASSWPCDGCFTAIQTELPAANIVFWFNSAWMKWNSA